MKNFEIQTKETTVVVRAQSVYHAMELIYVPGIEILKVTIIKG